MSEGTKISGPGLVVTPAFGIYEQSDERKHRLGDFLVVGGKKYVFAKAGEALDPGKLCTAAMDTDAEDTVTVAHPIGTRKVTITAATAIAADQYADGYLVVDEGTDAGHKYRIKSHPAIGNGDTGEITLYDPIVTAWVIANTDITLYTSKYLVQESNTDQVECPVGVPEIAVTSGYYFWLQIRGECQVLMDEVFGNATNQRLVTIGSSVAGAVEAYDAACEPIVGQMLLDAADSEDAKYVLIDLMLG